LPVFLKEENIFPTKWYPTLCIYIEPIVRRRGGGIFIPL